MSSDAPIPFRASSAGGAYHTGAGPVAVSTPPRRFKVGQIVWLKSGSPAMTVSDLNSTTPYVTVDWFDIEHQDCREAFHEDQLSESPRLWPSSVMWPMPAPIPVKPETTSG